jgi:hypothetical protein
MQEIEAKLSAIDSKQYYQLGLPSTSDLGVEQCPELDEISESGSEDVETIVHRYDPPASQTTRSEFLVDKSIAEEIREKQEAEMRPEPPPDLLLSSNCRRKIWPQFEAVVAQPAELIGDDDGDSSTPPPYEDINEDWDMILDNHEGGGQEAINEAVDVVVRQQPKVNEIGRSFYRNTRRMVEHQVQGVDLIRPNCGNCCILQ